jgi:anaerobic ribonucleoside-triphosphate reductase activating protein
LKIFLKRIISKILMNLLKVYKVNFSYPQIVFQEVPDEISLALNISGCPLGCPGCHSSFTWDKDFGEKLTLETLENLLKKHKFITCVLFYGGEWELETLIKYLDFIKSKNLKTALYTGLNLDEIPKILFNKLDYLKFGRYIKELGGLNSEKTNQFLLKL